jgi:hypothetical protein
MLPSELQSTVKELQSQLSRATHESEQSILQQKIAIAQSYLIDPTTIEINKWYRVEGMEKRFRVAYLKGVFAWGILEGEQTEEAFPIALLQQV